MSRQKSSDPMNEPVGLNSKKASKPQEGGIGEHIKVVVQALLIALFVRTILFQPFNIPSGSLIPTLLIGDYLFVSKYSYGYSKFSLPFAPPLLSGRIMASEPKRGDIAVFKLPRDGSTDYIKRVIGLPGDRVQMVQGRLLINGQMVQREAAVKIITRDAFGRDVPVATYKETLPGGVSHLVIERDGDTGYYDSTKVFEVPAGHFFMMGDNRDNSTDSRVSPEEGGVGFVPFENFVGRAEVIFFSVEEGEAAWQFWKWPWSVRWSRLFQPVR
jgi:signal peptidase I